MYDANMEVLVTADTTFPTSRSTTRRRTVILFLALLAPTVGTGGVPAAADERALFKPLPKDASTTERPVTAARVALGGRLFNDTILSKSKKLSCNSCHTLSDYGVDGQATSPGHDGQLGDRNSPTVYNAALHLAQFWDGRATDVEAQALGPVMNPAEMAMPSETEVVGRLKAEENYPTLFKEAFPGDADPVTFANMGTAIGAFERTLLTPSRFDRYLSGDDDALTPGEKGGFKKFVETGCAACHGGVGVGGAMYQKLGLVVPYETKDEGRYKVTKQESDRHVFKVPSLRNVEKTAPYFHDGLVKTLPEAVRLMAKHQLGRDLTDADVASIVTFLRSLTGTVPNAAR